MRQSQFERLLQDVGDTKDCVDTILSTFLDRIVQTSNRVERIEADTERTLLWVEALVRELDEQKKQSKPSCASTFIVSAIAFASGLVCGFYL